jgi:peptidyl-tRNA hydrolase
MDYVLLPLTTDEETAWQPVLERAADAVECFLREGIAAAMDRFNYAGSTEVAVAMSNT